jgi:hypothetical protein
MNKNRGSYSTREERKGKKEKRKRSSKLPGIVVK